MAEAAALALIKLLLGIGIFAVIGYVGRFYDKRIAGVLLTFPILNGIGILTGADPLAVANSIYVVVVFNGLLLFATVVWIDRLPPLPQHLPADVKLAARLIAWTLLWAAGAWTIVTFRDRLPGPAGLLAFQCVLAAAVAAFAWKAPRRPARPADDGAAPADAHLRAFLTFWSSRTGRRRLALFALCCVLLLAAATRWESKWVGMLSALPLPGLFAVATLSLVEARDDFARIGDSVLFGPPSVIVFNWVYAQIVVHLTGPADAVIGLAALVVLMTANAALIVWIVPRISAYLDKQHAS